MNKPTTKSKSNWSINDSDRLYKIRAWGKGYYRVNDAGNIAVCPHGNSKFQIDLKLLVDKLRKQKIRLPVLIRFMDILADRIKQIVKCFEKARRMFHYEGQFYPVYPLKVNQQRQVVESMIDAGREYNLGLEVGSKSELLAVLALSPKRENLIICNGYKDHEFIETALYANRLGNLIFLVVEQFNEVARIIAISKKLNVRPFIGIRVKLTTKGEGRWADTGGEKSKFGLRINELMAAIKLLSDNNLLESFELVHFHIGSQISNIQYIKEAMTEIARIYASLCKSGINIKYVDVGGGLGIDYDGSTSRSDYSVNYSPQEYANDVVYVLKAVCDSEHLGHPNVITESGRALTAHYSVLVTNAIDYSAPQLDPPSIPSNPSSPPLKELLQMYKEMSAESCREDYQDTIYVYKEAKNLFNMGQISLQERAQIEEIYWANLTKIEAIVQEHNLQYPEFDGLDKQLASAYVLNFSLFQSLPDCWAIDQVFPIVPIHRLNEKPDINCNLADITCDSDGRITNFIADEGIGNIIPLHKPKDTADYYIGFFLVGAYQEILGDYHNLFGDTNAVHVIMASEKRYKIAHHVKGDTIQEVLGLLDYQPKELVELLRKKLDDDVDQEDSSFEDAATQFLSLFESGLNGYTYLEG